MKRDKLKSLTRNLIPKKKKATQKIKQKLKTGLKVKEQAKESFTNQMKTGIDKINSEY